MILKCVRVHQSISIAIVRDQEENKNDGDDESEMCSGGIKTVKGNEVQK